MLEKKSWRENELPHSANFVGWSDAIRASSVDGIYVALGSDCPIVRAVSILCRGERGVISMVSWSIGLASGFGSGSPANEFEILFGGLGSEIGLLLIWPGVGGFSR